MGSLDDRVVLVSGGTQGVGLAIARAALREGARVVVTGRRADVGEAAVADLSALGDARFVRCDVADIDECRAAVKATVAAHGRVDGLVNAAGFTERGSVLDTTPEMFEQHVAVNLRGPFFLMQAAIGDMVRRGEPGSVVNVLTMSAHGGQPHLAPYSATKAGLAGLTRNAAYAHRFDRVRVNGVNIGWTDSDGEDVIQRRFHDAGDDWRGRAAERLPAGRLATPEDAAGIVVLLLSDASGVVTGSVMDWDQTVVGTSD
ncbi:NAD(P)-dependent dehydrogenase (short-subunit alcohol dehydrogenase family) [Aeromicrobium sp. SORGH_AS981]|uniref:SDR family oxidoreductase n=1 Tax=Aeromicrobium sp. SORGH_AS_0981 TaxID=3041802 RepID=UPI002855CFDD|nr:SDR family oxidoreductase [Aeromicrobium sp. SORGH_AS_0981]MDR6118891.1 NAD(P)-dependent dehydrogenase (short-subunit alcohol dehydrogenase family) [Aeromicrobium sp. SORGH_AS_0981]